MIADVSAAAEALNRGGVALLPTDTIYGLHALATDEAAIAKLASIKGRDEQKPFIILVRSIDQVEAIGAQLSARARFVLEQHWPGPLTAILPLQQAIAASRGKKSIAVRVPDLPWLEDLLRQTGPLASTSANLAGDPAVIRPQDLTRRLQENIDVVVDGGPLEGKASTIVDFTGEEPQVIREGEALFTQEVWKTLRKSL